MKLVVALVLAALAGSGFAAGLKTRAVLTNAVEAMEVLLLADKVRFDVCDDCPSKTLPLAANLKVELASGQIVAPRSPRPATVIYRVEDEVVIQVSFW